jgi:hypothetical protein
MNLEKLFSNLSKILSEKKNAKIEIKLVKKRGDEDEPISSPGRSVEEVRGA